MSVAPEIIAALQQGLAVAKTAYWEPRTRQSEREAGKAIEMLTAVLEADSAKQDTDQQIRSYPLVCVEWEDAYNRAGWSTEEEVDEFLEDAGFRCVNVGYLIRQTDSCVLIAARASHAQGQYGLIERIPRRMVISISNLTTRTEHHAMPGSELPE